MVGIQDWVASCRCLRRTLADPRWRLILRVFSETRETEIENLLHRTSRSNTGVVSANSLPDAPLKEPRRNTTLEPFRSECQERRHEYALSASFDLPGKSHAVSQVKVRSFRRRSASQIPSLKRGQIPRIPARRGGARRYETPGFLMRPPSMA